MTVLFDNDAIKKLAAYGLLADAPQLLSPRRTPRARVLSTAQFQLRMRDRAKAVRRHGEAVTRRIEEFLRVADEVVAAPDTEAMTTLAAVQGIDAGEAILFAVAAADAECVVVTGDKKSLEAMAASPACKAIAARLAGRIVCLEQILQLAVASLGFETMASLVREAPSEDTAIRIIFSPGNDQASATAGLKSYVEDLRSHTATLLSD